MQRAARSCFLGHSHYTNEATPFLSEYLEHKRLRGIGIGTERRQLGEYMTAVFLILDETFDKLIDEKRRRESLKKR